MGIEIKNQFSSGGTNGWLYGEIPPPPIISKPHLVQF